jgi:hypothetical protein
MMLKVLCCLYAVGGCSWKKRKRLLLGTVVVVVDYYSVEGLEDSAEAVAAAGDA